MKLKNLLIGFALLLILSVGTQAQNAFIWNTNGFGIDLNGEVGNYELVGGCTTIGDGKTFLSSEIIYTRQINDAVNSYGLDATVGRFLSQHFMLTGSIAGIRAQPDTENESYTNYGMVMASLSWFPKANLFDEGEKWGFSGFLQYRIKDRDFFGGIGLSFMVGK